jgi:5-methylcytosine-specific restriction endonuclease McrA
MQVSPEACPALVLNAEYRPLSYFPLSLWSWQNAIKAAILERAPSFEMRLPSVVSLKDSVKPALHPAFTRFNVFLRDRFQCRYCGSRDALTILPIIARFMGGLTNWLSLRGAANSAPIPSLGIYSAGGGGRQ